jgi:hypothetical protein
VPRAALLVIPILGLIAMTAMSHQPTDCTLPPVSARHLNLSNNADRHELAVELARIDTIADHYREVIRRVPRESDSVDAVRTLSTRPDRAYRYCRAILRDELATTYDLDITQLSDVVATD